MLEDWSIGCVGVGNGHKFGVKRNASLLSLKAVGRTEGAEHAKHLEQSLVCRKLLVKMSVRPHTTCKTPGLGKERRVVSSD